MSPGSGDGGAALDPGSAWVKRMRVLPQGPAPWPDLARGRLRTPRAALPEGGLGLAALLGEVGRPAALALVAPDEGAVPALAEAAQRGAPGARVVVLPAAVAAALDAAGEGEPPDGTREAVLDLGHTAVRLWPLEWRRWAGRAYPRLLGPGHGVPLGGERLDEELAALGRLEGGEAPSPSAAGFAELKELCGASRGPFARALCDGRVVELAARDAGEALRAWLEGLTSALLTLVEAAREARVERVLAAGGLLELAPVAELVRRAFPAGPGPRLVLAPRPGFAACRGAARALDRPAVPLAAGELGVPVREGPRVVLRPLVPAGAALPGRSFGPIGLQPLSGAAGPVAVHLLDPEGQEGWVARLPAAGRLEISWRWSWELGWSCRHAGGEVRAEPLAASEAAALRSAVQLDWAAHGRALPLDLLLVFRATRGAPAAAALTAAAAERVLQAAQEAAPGARLRALAVGDHPQGHLAPAWVTRCAPWSQDLAQVLGFVRERLAEAVEGIDPAEAFECALREANGLDWAPGSNRVLVLLGDAPPHLPEEPPYCPVDWRAEVAALRERGVRLVPVHLSAAGVPPALRERTLAFLGGLGPVVTARAKAVEEAAAVVSAAAAAREPDEAARALLARVQVEVA